MTRALLLAILAIPLTAHAMWFDRPKIGGRGPWACRGLYALSWAAITAAAVLALLDGWA